MDEGDSNGNIRKGKSQVSFVKLFERVPVETSNFLQDAFIDQYRVLWLNEFGKYEIVIFREVTDADGKDAKWIEYSRKTPIVQGAEHKRYIDRAGAYKNKLNKPFIISAYFEGKSLDDEDCGWSGSQDKIEFWACNECNESFMKAVRELAISHGFGSHEDTEEGA